MSYPKNPWGVILGVKLPPVLRPFFGVSLGGAPGVSIGGVKIVGVRKGFPL